MKIAILGLGVEGVSTLRFLKKKYPKAEFVILDRKHKPDGLRKLTKTERHTLKQEYGPSYLKNLAGFDIVYRAPGVPYNLKEIRRALKKGVEITSATELFLKGARGTVIGITGTKGKSTTSTLIYKILKDAEFDTYICGNIGTPAIKLIPKLRKQSFTVLELSSFQLQGIKTSPHIAVILGIFPDHMDAHKSFNEYASAKSNITKYQTSNDVVFYFPENELSESFALESDAKSMPVSLGLLPIKLKIPGEHNIRNAAMAAAVTSYLGVPPISILETIENFHGLPHRLQFIRTVRGIRFYDDSASTNPQTTAAAIMSFPNIPKILIAGGKDKGLDYKPLSDALSKNNVKITILFGENKNKIYRAIKGKTKVNIASNLKTAVSIAFKNAISGDVVLFSPGAASFDMFDNYSERGNAFKAIVKSLKG